MDLQDRLFRTAVTVARSNAAMASGGDAIEEYGFLLALAHSCLRRAAEVRGDGIQDPLSDLVTIVEERAGMAPAEGSA